MCTGVACEGLSGPCELVWMTCGDRDFRVARICQAVVYHVFALVAFGKCRILVVLVFLVRSVTWMHLWRFGLGGRKVLI